MGKLRVLCCDLEKDKMDDDPTLTSRTPIAVLTPKMVAVAPTVTSTVAIPKAFAEYSAPLKSSIG